MKKEVLSGVLFILIMLILSFAIAQDNGAELSTEEKATACLEDKIGNCSSPSSLEEKIFSLLAIGLCQDEVIGASKSDGECWPSPSCNLETTAKAILALKNANSDISKAESWLLSQNRTATGLDWFLQIDGDGPMWCDVKYDYGTAEVTTRIVFREDKTIEEIGATGGTSTVCFPTTSEGAYWAEIALACHDREFEITCNESALTTLLYQKSVGDDEPIYVSSETHNQAVNVEKPNSMCFKQGTACNYQGSLWAALVLDSLGHDMTPYYPYLVTMKDDYSSTLPEAFLWHLLGDQGFYSELLNRQKPFGYWETSREGKYYDTAVALYTLFHSTSSDEKTNAIAWLEGAQETNGCWNHGNVRDTAFLAYSLYGDITPSGGIDVDGDVDGDGNGNGNGDGVDGLGDCEVTGGGYCMSGYSCLMEAGGDILDDYDCAAGYVCCSVELIFDTCLDQNGEICDIGETCFGGTTVAAFDTGPGQDCCLGGTCETSVAGAYTCEDNGGECRMHGCKSNEKEDLTYTCEYGDPCCFEEGDDGTDGGTTPGEGISGTWIWVLLILIVLVVLGIIFKDQLRRILFRAKSAGRGRGPAGPGFGRGPPRPPPGYSPPAPLTGRPESMPMPRGPPRRGPPRPRRGRGEIDDVLKKLKDMGR